MQRAEYLYGYAPHREGAVPHGHDQDHPIRFSHLISKAQRPSPKPKPKPTTRLPHPPVSRPQMPANRSKQPALPDACPHSDNRTFKKRNSLQRRPSFSPLTHSISHIAPLSAIRQYYCTARRLPIQYWPQHGHDPSELLLAA
jgi:hypothetical protein